MSAFSFALARVAEAARYVGSDATFFALAVAATAGPQVAADLVLSEQQSLFAAGMLGLVQLYVNLLITYRVLHRSGAAPAGDELPDLTEARFGSAFAMSLLSSLAILAGLLLLIVPGIFLALLWSLALPILAAERADAIDSLRRSWHLARSALAPLGALVVLWVVALVLLGVAAALPEIFAPTSGSVTVVALNVAVSALLPFTAGVWTFAYITLRNANADSRSATA